MKDLILDKDYKMGSKGQKVKLIQEWLSIHGIHLAIDGDFGPATDYAVRQFQKKKKLKVDGVVDSQTFERLTQPMSNSLKTIAPRGKTLGDLVVSYGQQHLAQHPIEIGGQNKGPWVRLYMKGHEGPDWPWCAGFVSFVLKQASDTIGQQPPIKATFSCDILAASAREKGFFLGESKIQNKNQITPGSLFLNRRTSTDWVHTGIVVKAENDFYHTIEGNTNDEGSREGYEVCKRIRGYKKKDFILI